MRGDNWFVPKNLITPNETTDKILAFMKGTEGGYVSCLNVHSHEVALKNILFKNALESANLVISDGVAVTILQKFYLKRSVAELRSFTGYELFELVAHFCKNERTKVAAIGGDLNSNNKFVEKLRNDPDICCDVLGFAPEFSSTVNENVLKSMIDFIRKNKIEHVLLFLGSPKQDLYGQMLNSALPKAKIYCIGAVIDFYINPKKRAPLIVRKFGLEWLYRFYQEPIRMLPRAGVSVPKFGARLVLLYFRSLILRK